MLENLEVLALDLEIQVCNGNNCQKDCVLPGVNNCNAKWTGAF